MADQPAAYRRYDFDRVVRLLLTAGGVFALFLLVRFLSDVLIPFAVALLMAYLLNPIVNAIESRIGGRAPAVFLTVAGALVLLAALLIIVIPICADQVQEFAHQIRQLDFVQNITQGPSPSTQAEPGVRPIVQAYREFHGRQPSWLQRMMDGGVRAASESLRDENLAAGFKTAAAKLAPGLWGVVSGVFSFLLGLTAFIVVLIYLVFLLLDYRRVAGRWQDLLPPAYRPAILQFVDDFSLAMRRYFRGQFLVALATGTVLAVGFGLIGLRMGVVLGLGIGILNMVPYLQAVGLVPAALLAVLRALEQGSGVFTSLALVLLVFGVAQFLQDVVIGPRILGKATGLRPWTILLGVFIWGKLLGFLGLVLAIPLTCMGLAYYSRFVLGKLDAKVIEEK